MAAKIIDGKAVAEEIKERLAIEAKALRAASRPVRLLAVQVGEDAASKLYTDMQARHCESVGIEYELLELPGDIAQEDFLARIEQINADASVSGVILQMPLPEQIDTARAQTALAPGKDVEGTHPENMGRLFTGTGLVAPCTPMAAFELLQRACADLSGKETVVVGRSTIVGKPIAMMLQHKKISATVTICHSRTKDLAFHTRRADVVVAATGYSQTCWRRYRRQVRAGEGGSPPALRPLIEADMVSEGAIVIDVATNRIPKGFDGQGQPLKNDKGKTAMRTVGDVDFEGVRGKVAAITPVPGGVGPVTVAMLLKNTIECAKRSG